MKPLLVVSSALLLSLFSFLSLQIIMAAEGIPCVAGNVEQQPKEPLNVAAILEAVRSGTTLDFVEKFAGEKINESNFNKVVADLTDATGDAEKEEARGNLNGKEAQLRSSLLAAIKDGKITSKSALGNRFRSEVDTKGMTQAQISQHRLEWANDLVEKLDARKTTVKEWRKVDSTAFPYRPFGKLVIDFGGWKDADAIKGATTGALQCLAMGEPWVRIHPQTKMVCFAIAEMGWREEFEQAWRSTVTYYTGDVDKADTGSSASSGLKRPAVEEGASSNTIPTNKVTRAQPTSVTKGKADTIPQSSPRKDTPSKAEQDDKVKVQKLFRDGTKVKNNFTAATGKAEDAGCLT